MLFFLPSPGHSYPQHENLNMQLPMRIITRDPIEPSIGDSITPAYKADPKSTQYHETTGDLQQTVDTQPNQRILELLEELDNDPVKIYEYVHNKIDYEPYFGSKKGAIGTYYEKGGNDFDQCSLLISLYRQIGIPCRYIYGVIEIDIETAKNWLGVKTLEAALLRFYYGGIPCKTVIKSQKITVVQIRHCWVEAKVPFFPLSGHPHPEAENTIWIPLDPSFKQYTIFKDIEIIDKLDFSTFDFLSEYISKLRTQTPDLALRDKVDSCLKAYYPEKNLTDALARRDIIPEALDVLPESLKKDITVVGIIDEYSQIPEAYQYALSFSIGNITYKQSTPSLYGQRITISYTPSTEQDIALAQQAGSMYKADLNTIKLRPVLRIEGVPIEEDEDNKSLLTIGDKQNLYITITWPSLHSSVGGQENIQHQLTVGAYYGCGVDMNRVMAEVMEDRTNKLAKARSHIGRDQVSIDDVIGEMLYINSMQYWHKVSLSSDIISKLLDVSYIKYPSIALSFINIYKSTNMNAIGTLVEGMTIDVKGYIYSPVSNNDDQTRIKDFHILNGMTMSTYEHKIFEDIYGVGSVSTMKILQMANEQGIKVHIITGSTIDTILPLLNLEQPIKDTIFREVSHGRLIIIPETILTTERWRGIGYIILDMQTGLGGYIISSAFNGGRTAQELGGFIGELCTNLDQVSSPNFTLSGYIWNEELDQLGRYELKITSNSAIPDILSGVTVHKGVTTERVRDYTIEVYPDVHAPINYHGGSSLDPLMSRYTVFWRWYDENDNEYHEDILWVNKNAHHILFIAIFAAGEEDTLEGGTDCIYAYTLMAVPLSPGGDYIHDYYCYKLQQEPIYVIGGDPLSLQAKAFLSDTLEFEPITVAWIEDMGGTFTLATGSSVIFQPPDNPTKGEIKIYYPPGGSSNLMGGMREIVVKQPAIKIRGPRLAYAAVGDTIDFDADNWHSSCEWKCTPDSVGSINNGSGEFTAEEAGICRVMVVNRGGSVLDAVDVHVIKVDLDVDTDRNGVVDDIADEYGEDIWEEDRGAIYNVNFDRDGSRTNGGEPIPDAIHFDDTGVPVMEDFFIEDTLGRDDEKDIAPLVIRKIDSPIFNKYKLYLKVGEQEDIQRIHIYKKIEADSVNRAIWGAMTGPQPPLEIDITQWIDPSNTNYQGNVVTGDTTFGIEGLCFRFQGTNAPSELKFDGYIDLTLELREGIKVISSDSVCMKVAPWIMLSRDQSSEEIWAQDDGFNNLSFITALDSSGQLHKVTTAVTQWFQDHIEIGFTQRPGGPKTHIVFRLPYDRGPGGSNPIWPLKKLLKRNVGVFQIGSNLGGNKGDYGGNLEVLPPDSTHNKLGRIVLGTPSSTRMQDFLQSQEVQRPIFDIPVGWLKVGHIDEVSSFLASRTIAIADPTTAWNLMTVIPPADRGRSVFFATGAASPISGLASADSLANNRIETGIDHRGQPWRYIRIYQGAEAGTVGFIDTKGLGYITVSRVWKTTSKIIDGTYPEYDIFYWSEDIRYGGGGPAPAPPTWRPQAGDKYVLCQGSKKWITGTPAIVTVEEVLADADFGNLNKIDIQNVIDKDIKPKLQTAISGVSFKKLPALFFGKRGAGFLTNHTAIAFNPGPTNLQPVAGNLYVPEQFCPVDIGSSDIFEKSINATFGASIVKYVDGWYLYHAAGGELHCGTIVKRAVLTINWWENQP